jgi:hypothetical protein
VTGIHATCDCAFPVNVYLARSLESARHETGQCLLCGKPARSKREDVPSVRYELDGGPRYSRGMADAGLAQPPCNRQQRRAKAARNRRAKR